MRKLLIISLSFLFTVNALANNLSITNVSRDGDEISFYVYWENSWSVSPFNDAVWVFLKQSPNNSPSWSHVNVTVANATGAGNATATADGVGIFVTRSTAGNGTIGTTVTATMSGLQGVYQDIKVMGVEMVRIPQGQFYAGDGSSGIARGDDLSEPAPIMNELEKLCGSGSSNIQYHGSVCDDIPAEFPKGYASIYSMKYTITQQQYVDFLNCIPRMAQQARVESDITGTTVTNRFVMTNTTTSINNNVIRCDENIGTGNVTFYCDRNNNEIPNEADDGQQRGCNYLSAADLLAYLDWAGLRPMSFLEYEKIARGTLFPVAQEYSWGSTAYTSSTGLVRLNTGTSSEMWSVSGSSEGISTLNGRVIRVGANALSSGATRELSNGTYYGVIDLGNNPGDFYIGKEFVDDFTNDKGDGNISTQGEANNVNWPSFAPTDFVRIHYGSPVDAVSFYGLILSGRSSNSGGRGVR